jgi:glycosyltransferase involved in cell wall biosynthesis
LIVLSLSAVVISRNEEAYIERCLKSVFWADEILVVDSGSTDRTMEIARRCGAKVLCHTWSGFGPQKNWAIEKCKGEWVLSLDADEEITPELSAEIKKVLEEDPTHSAFQILRRNYYHERFMHCWWPDVQQRLFKKGRAWFEEVPVHERLVVHGSTGKLVGHLKHRAVSDLTEYLEKFNRYTSSDGNILRQKKSKDGIKSSFLMQGVIRPIKTFLEFYFWRQGFRDGWPGLYISLMSSVYRMAAAVKSSETEKTLSESA